MDVRLAGHNVDRDLLLEIRRALESASAIPAGLSSESDAARERRRESPREETTGRPKPCPPPTRGSVATRVPSPSSERTPATKSMRRVDRTKRSSSAWDTPRSRSMPSSISTSRAFPASRWKRSRESGSARTPRSHSATSCSARTSSFPKKCGRGSRGSVPRSAREGKCLLSRTPTKSSSRGSSIETPSLPHRRSTTACSRGSPRRMPATGFPWRRRFSSARR